jgi:hypothetical protein
MRVSAKSTPAPGRVRTCDPRLSAGHPLPPGPESDPRRRPFAGGSRHHCWLPRPTAHESRFSRTGRPRAGRVPRHDAVFPHHDARLGPRRRRLFSKIGVGPSEQAVDGQPFVFSVTLGDYTSPDITAYCWSKESLESVLLDAGMIEIRWIAPTPSSGGINQHGPDFWVDVMRRPFELGVTCRKS